MARSALLFFFLLATPAFAADDVAILAYHQVVPVADKGWAATVDDFRDHMLLLETMDYSVVSMADAYDYLTGKKESLPRNPVVLTVDDGWADSHSTIFPILKEFNYPWSLYIYPRIISHGENYLKWPQVLEMARAGIDIQGHTWSHAHLNHTPRNAKLTPAEYDAFLKKELADSKNEIEKKVGKPVRFLAYPYGEYDDAVVAATEKHGYAVGLTSRAGMNTRKTNPLTLYRYAIANTTTLQQLLELGLGARPLKVSEASATGAIITNASELDPATVRIALLGENAKAEFDPRTGRVTIEPEKLTRKRHHVLVWGNRLSDGRRMAGTWTF